MTQIPRLSKFKIPSGKCFCLQASLNYVSLCSVWAGSLFTARLLLFYCSPSEQQLDGCKEDELPNWQPSNHPAFNSNVPLLVEAWCVKMFVFRLEHLAGDVERHQSWKLMLNQQGGGWKRWYCCFSWKEIFLSVWVIFCTCFNKWLLASPRTALTSPGEQIWRWTVGCMWEFWAADWSTKCSCYLVSLHYYQILMLWVSFMVLYMYFIMNFVFNESFWKEDKK